MTWQVRIQEDDILRRKARLWVVDYFQGSDHYTVVGSDGQHWTRSAFGTEPADPPTIELPTASLEPLREALNRHLGKGDIDYGSMLRQDFEHERARVDRLVEKLLSVEDL
jgi:hypothetical protein